MSELYNRVRAEQQRQHAFLSDMAEALADAEHRHAEERRAIERQIADMAVRLDTAQRERDAAKKHSEHAHLKWSEAQAHANRWCGVLPLLRALTAYAAEDGGNFTPVREAIQAAYEAGVLDGLGESKTETDTPSGWSMLANGESLTITTTVSS